VLRALLKRLRHHRFSTPVDSVFLTDVIISQAATVLMVVENSVASVCSP